jgi:hypothetical protein
MNIQMTKKGIALSEVDLVNFEKNIGYVLPDPYRKFILTYNGGEPSPYYFKVPQWRYQQSLVNELKGINPGGASVDITKVIDLMDGRLPKAFIPIGDDPGGNLILIGLDGATRGKIYFFDHENEPIDPMDKLEDYPNIYFLANDFDSFLNSLRHENEL